ncbi:MAG: ABC transporter substrate-binding protein [Eubacteriales bacterium]|nr:ABC transporter substrate-binding protein [Eubacteriales bacterium]
MKKTLSILLVLVMAISLVACQPAQPAAPAASADAPAADAPAAAPAEAGASDTIKLAVVGPMTGQDAEYGLGFRQSAQIMADKWNANGGCLGKQVELVVFDDKGAPEEGANVAEQIVADESIVAVVGHFSSSLSMAAAPIYQEHGMLEISPCSSHADYTGIGDWIWRVSPLSADEARTVSKFVANYWGAKKVGQLVMNNDWGADIAELEAEFLKSINPDIEVVQELVVEGNDDYGPVVTNFMAAGVDTVICDATYTVAAPFAKQMRLANPEIRVVAHGNCQVEQLIEVLGDQSNNFYCSCSWSPIFSDEETKFYCEKYAEMDANDTTPIGDFVQYYDTVGLILQAITNCGSTDREAIRAELAKIEYQGLSGLLKFDENRDCPRDYGMVYWDQAQQTWIQNTEWNS